MEDPNSGFWFYHQDQLNYLQDDVDLQLGTWVIPQQDDEPTQFPFEEDVDLSILSELVSILGEVS